MFARSDNVGKFQLRDILAICGMIKREPIDGAYHFANHLHNQANSPIENIVVGGLITHIAKRLGVNFDDVIPLHEIQRIDMKYLIFVKMLERAGSKKTDPIFLRLNDARFCQLPFDPPLPVSVKANWRPLHLPQSLSSMGVQPQLGHSVPSTSRTPPPPPTQVRDSSHNEIPQPHEEDASMEDLPNPDNVNISLEEQLNEVERDQTEILLNQASMEVKLDKLLLLTGKLVERQEQRDKDDKKFKKMILRLLKKKSIISDTEVGEEKFDNPGFEAQGDVQQYVDSPHAKSGVMKPLAKSYKRKSKDK